MDVFKAIADPTRREILLMVSKESTSVNSIADRFDMSRPAISKHIKILAKSELILISSNDGDGRQRFCTAQLEAMQEIRTFLSALEKTWNSRFDALGDFLNEME